MDLVEREAREGHEVLWDRPGLGVVLETRDPRAASGTSECRASRGRRAGWGTWVRTEPLDPGGSEEGRVHPELWVHRVSAASRVLRACRDPRAAWAAGAGREPRGTTDWWVCRVCPDPSDRRERRVR